MGDLDQCGNGNPGCWNRAPPISADRVAERQTAHAARKGGAIVDRVGGIVLKSHEGYFGDPRNLRVLEAGDVLFTFTCRKGRSSAYERDMLRAIANLSSFRDETAENHVPPFDVRCKADMKRYTFVLQKCAYVLPGVGVDDIARPELISSVEYHASCQPRGTRVWTDVTEECTFRITKPIIPRIFSVTMQLKVSRIGQSELSDLSRHMGIRFDRGLLMERTRRTRRPKPDATAKAKSVLLYAAIPDGVLVTNATVVLNKGLPEIIANIVDTFGSWGLREACETATLTRRYLRGRAMLPAEARGISPPAAVGGDALSAEERREEPEIFYDVPDDGDLRTATPSSAENGEHFFDAPDDEDSILPIPETFAGGIQTHLNGGSKSELKPKAKW